MSNTATDEQIAAIEATKNPDASLSLDALAGTGKTTTLTMLAQECKGPSLALAFNKSIAEELKGRFPQNFDIKTMNGLGFGVLRREFPKITNWNLDGRKLGKIITRLGRERKDKLSTEDWDSIRRVVTAAQLQGIVPGSSDGLIPDSEELWTDLCVDCMIDEGEISRIAEYAFLTLVESNKEIENGNISFDDQVYWPIAFGAKFPRYGRVLVDEAQDLNRLNHAALERTSSGWLGVCGDPRQSIYAFRGSVNDSMGRIKGLKSKWNDLGLTLTFRCPKKIVARQWGHAPRYRAHEANPEGEVLKWNGGWNWEKLWGVKYGTLPIAILCRNNAPLLALAFKLIRQRISVQVMGRDIGKGLESLTKKLAPEDSVPLTQLLAKLHEWADGECAIAKANDHEEKIAGIEDRRECIVALSDPSVRTAGELRAVLSKLFADGNPTVVLGSIHKAKGLEWSTVLHLDPWRIPSRFAKKEGGEALAQEWNLKYVLETRTKHTLIEADLKGFDTTADEVRGED
jgi:superfamily I DNA/RNA helicase